MGFVDCTSAGKPNNSGMEPVQEDSRANLWGALIGDGRPLLALVAIGLILAGGFALFLSATGHFLPHDESFLGMNKQVLCGLQQCRIVHFMFHDRVSFGGTLVAIGVLYLWLGQFPLHRGEPWAWWTFLVSGLSGFGSFLAYLGYGYLDSWHGAATLALLPIYVGGMWVTWRAMPQRRGPRTLLVPAVTWPYRTSADWGRLLLLATASGLVLAGMTIMVVGMTSVFVPQDLTYIGISAPELAAINPRLIPLIAHDRAGFGGGIATCGLTLFLCVWCGKPTRHLWQAVTAAGTIGFLPAIGVHPLIGYNDLSHLAPAVVGAVLFTLGTWLSYLPRPSQASAEIPTPATHPVPQKNQP
jgi:hypothetical protein